MLSLSEMLRRYSIHYHSEMKAITRPLSELFDINYFHFHQVKEDGRFFFISNCIEYNEFYFSQPEIRATNPYTISPQLISEGIYDWETQDFPGKSKAVDFYKTLLNIDRNITLFRKIKDGYIIGSFGLSHTNPHLVNLFTNNVHVLNRYLSYFIEESSFILKDCEDNAVDLNTVMGDNFHTPRYFMRDCNETVQTFYERLDFGKANTLPVPAFSKREKECLRCCLEGLTAEQTRKKLFLSRRTIEHRVEDIKRKLGCNKKSEIIQAVRDLELQGFDPLL